MLITLFIGCLTLSVSGQTVSTFLTGNGLNGPDGFALDNAQNLFVANWGGGAGYTVLKNTPGAIVNKFDSTSNAPDGLAFDETGNLYVSRSKIQYLVRGQYSLVFDGSSLSPGMYICSLIVNNQSFYSTKMICISK